jgi:predicted transposase/invertase (TIGR01784 family)
MEREERLQVVRKENVVQRYVDILTNSGFKAFFGDVNNKEAIISILNVLLPEHRKIMEMDILPTEHQGAIVDMNKEYHYDFMCRDASGVVFIVELQKYWEDDWFQRCVCYSSRAYDRQSRKGEDYNVPPVYLIGLMDVRINHPDKEFWKDRYISEYTFREKVSHDLLAETIVIIFAEMANFSKTEEECLTETDQMLYVLKNIGRLMEQPSWLQKEVFDRIFRGCEIAGFNEEKRIIYEQEMYDEKRRRSEMNTAIRMGREEGRAEGRAEGLAEGRVEIAKGMLSDGMPVDKISKYTGLTAEEIMSLMA